MKNLRTLSNFLPSAKYEATKIIKSIDNNIFTKIYLDKPKTSTYTNHVSAEIKNLSTLPSFLRSAKYGTTKAIKPIDKNIIVCAGKSIGKIKTDTLKNR